MTKPFRGAKIALFCGRDLVAFRRDDIPHIDWPGYLDLPGGARDPDETPEACVLRETHEEADLIIAPDRLVWRRCYDNGPGVLPSWFFAAAITPGEASSVRLGDEGQWVGLMPVADFLAAGDAVPHLQDRLRDVLADHALAGWASRNGVSGWA